MSFLDIYLGQISPSKSFKVRDVVKHSLDDVKHAPKPLTPLQQKRIERQKRNRRFTDAELQQVRAEQLREMNNQRRGDFRRQIMGLIQLHGLTHFSVHWLSQQMPTSKVGLNKRIRQWLAEDGCPFVFDSYGPSCTGKGHPTPIYRML